MRTAENSPPPESTQAAVLNALVNNYPALHSDRDVVSMVARDPDRPTEEIEISDALKQLRADRLVRRHERRFWSASPVAVKIYSLLDL